MKRTKLLLVIAFLLSILHGLADTNTVLIKLGWDYADQIDEWDMISCTVYYQTIPFTNRTVAATNVMKHTTATYTNRTQIAGLQKDTEYYLVVTSYGSNTVYHHTAQSLFSNVLHCEYPSSGTNWVTYPDSDTPLSPEILQLLLQ